MPHHLRALTALLALALAVALSLTAAPAAAKRETPQPGLVETEEGVFVDTLQVTLVNVDVYVTDKKGDRVTGLTREDFEIYEDGRPMAISHFAEVQGGKVVRSWPESLPLESAPGEAAPEGEEPEPAPLPEDQRLHLVVYVDNFNLQPFNRNRVLRELRDFLRQHMTTEDRMMLVTYDREPHVRLPWTRDPQVIASSLIELETMSGHAIHRDSDRRDALRRIEESESPQAALSFARTYASSIFNDLAFTISALREIVDGLAGMPGRKAVLYVSEGVPMIAGEDLFYAVQQKFGEYTSLTDAFEFDASRRFQELTGAANANRVTFYTIDVGGLRTYSYADASQDRPGQGAFVEQVHISNLQSPLQLMAEETGGKAIINSNRVGEPLEEVAGDFRSYYSLGYTPSHFGDGRYYKIEVKLKKGVGRRLEVRHREGYRDKPPEARMADGTLAVLLHQLSNNPLGVRLDFGPQSRNDKGLYQVKVDVTIPLQNIVLVPQGETHEARLSLYVAAMDDEGGMSEVQESTVPISIPAAQVAEARGQLYLYSLNLLMRDGPHRVAVGIRDEVGAEASFVIGQVTVGR